MINLEGRESYTQITPKHAPTSVLGIKQDEHIKNPRNSFSG